MLVNVENSLKQEILKIKKEKNAVILSHYYQMPDIQDIADHLGDSLLLSQLAQRLDCRLIVFCGVYFMAETAKILAPEKRVLIPDQNAGCSLADSCSKEGLEELKNRFPDHLVLSYINCNAEIKALSDIICTSGNVIKIVNSLPKKQKIIFTPDKNLGAYVNNITGRDMILWDGSCEVHDIITLEQILELKTKHPNASLIAHPECKAQVLVVADFVGSTAGMLEHIKNDSGKEYIVATESGIIHQMKRYRPEKKFYAVTKDNTCACNDCKYMKMITLEKVFNSLSKEEVEVKLDRELLKKALVPLERMMRLS